MRRHALAGGEPLGHPRLELALPKDFADGGWYLLRGTLLRRGGDYDARLYYESPGGDAEADWFPVPAAASGAVHELLEFPPGVRRLTFDAGSGAEAEATNLQLARVPRWQRGWWMLRRVLPQLWLQPPGRRKVAGLTLWRALRNLRSAYESTSRLRAHAAAPAYGEWIRSFDTLEDHDREQIVRHAATWQRPPFFHVFVAGGDEQARRRSLASLDAQLFRGFGCTADGEGALAAFNDELAAAPARHWAVLVRAGDVLAPHALYWMAWAALQQPEARVLYADEDTLDAAGQRTQPRFKPAWSWTHARATPFFGAALALRADALAQAGGLTAGDCAEGAYDAVLRVMDAAAEAGEDGAAWGRIPAVLLHRAARAAETATLPAVQAHLRRRGLQAVAERGPAGTCRLRHPLPPRPPLVSIIVPTRDALELTRRCLESLRRLTSYPAYEVLLVDNRSTDADALAWMREQSAQGLVRLLHFDGPFNYSAINNMAVQHARGELLCLLNNDTQVVAPGWLEEMVGQLLEPGVDVVGAKLLYPDGRVQHGGDILGVGGVANHAHVWLGAEEPGYCERAVVAQDYCAVTGACLLTRRARFLALGGLDERHLEVSFNDVDYCLRVRESGGRVVWTPHAVLLHHEFASRGRDLSGAPRRRARREAAYMRRRWSEALAQDPFYHPYLHRGRADFSLDPAPVIVRPWQAAGRTA